MASYFLAMALLGLGARGALGTDRRITGNESNPATTHPVYDGGALPPPHPSSRNVIMEPEYDGPMSLGRRGPAVSVGCDPNHVIVEADVVRGCDEFGNPMMPGSGPPMMGGPGPMGGMPGFPGQPGMPGMPGMPMPAPMAKAPSDASVQASTIDAMLQHSGDKQLPSLLKNVASARLKVLQDDLKTWKKRIDEDQKEIDDLSKFVKKPEDK